MISEGHNAIAVIKRRVISYRAPFEVTVSLEKYTGPLRPDEGALGNTGTCIITNRLLNFYFCVQISILQCKRVLFLIHSEVTKILKVFLSLCQEIILLS